MCMLQETKMHSMDDFSVHSIWGQNDLMWSAKNVVGHFGGSLLMWNPSLLQAQFSFEGTGFVGIKSIWKGMVVYFVNVYSPCSIIGKRRLWSNLIKVKASLPIREWCVYGDFNAIKRRSEPNWPRSQFV